MMGDCRGTESYHCKLLLTNQKMFCICGQVKDVDIGHITWLKEGSPLHDRRSSLRELMKLGPEELDYKQLKRKDVFKSSVCIENEAGALEEEL